MHFFIGDVMFIILKRKRIKFILIIIIHLCLFLGLAGFKTYLHLSLVPVLGEAQIIIVIDAGHGGRDPGAVVGSIYEKEINLDVAKRLQKALVNEKYRVIMTRKSDTNLVNWKDRGSYQRASLWQRAYIARKNKASILISIHCNCDRTNKYFGFQTFYHEKSIEGKKLATCIQDELIKIRPTRRQAIPGEYYLLNNTSCTTVIVELGYLSNPKDRALLNSAEYREKMAQAIARGITKLNL